MRHSREAGPAVPVLCLLLVVVLATGIGVQAAAGQEFSAVETLSSTSQCTPMSLDLTFQALPPEEQLTPISVPDVTYLSNGFKVATQRYEFLDPEGNLVTAAVTCTSTCKGNGCQIQGCVPKETDCTACSCKKAPGEPKSPPCSHCTCMKTVSGEAL